MSLDLPIFCPDDKFGPHIGPPPAPGQTALTCRGGFDFTLLFEESILSIPLSIILLIVLPFRILQLIRQPVQVGASVLRPLKVGFNFCLILVQGALLALWASTSDKTITHTRGSVPAAALGFAASLAVFPLSWLEHERTIRPSFVLSVYFFLTTLCDLPRTRTLWLLGDYQTIPILQTFCQVLRIVILALESTEKRNILLTKKFLSYEITSSTISRAGFFWLIPLFKKGFKRNLLLEDLYPLDPELESVRLHSTLSKAWNEAPNRGVPGALIGVWMSAFRLGLWAPVFPRLCIIAFTYTQPFLMEKAILLAFLPDNSIFNNWGYGLIGAFLLTYGGSAIAAGQYAWRVRRSAARMRGSVIALIYEKSLNLDITSKSVSPAGALTLVGNDVEGIIQGMNQLHELWAGLVEIIIAVYLIGRKLGAACAMPIVVAFLVILVTGSMAIPSGTAQALWIAASQSRVTATSKTLGSIKWIKVSGLNDMAFALIRRLRTAELAVSLRFRLLLAGTMVMLIVVPVWSPILTFSTYAGIAKSKGDAAELVVIFTSYSLITLLNGPLSNLIVALPILAGAFTSFLRIQAHLNGKQRNDTRINLMDEKHRHLLSEQSDGFTSDTATGSESYEMTDRKSVVPSATLDKDIIASLDGTFSWKKDSDPVINLTGLNIRKGALTFIVGPVGCGKSTLLKALLGELSSFKGSIRVNYSGGMTFSDQIPWVPNETVRSIIVGSSDYDEKWYKTVVRAVALDEDFINWPAGESTVAGTKGISMSGGQKQRLSIARALYSRREFLVFDDCLSGLDATTSKIVFESLFGSRGLLRGGDRTVVASSSDVSRLRYADDIILLDEFGSVKQQGTPRELAQVLDFSLYEDEEMGDSRKKSSWKPAAVVTSAAKELADQEILEDKSRRLGDTGMYGFYAKAAGRTTLAILLVSMSIYAFCGSFPTVWLGWWTEDKDPLGNLGKWLGVYVVLGIGSIAAVGCGIYQILVRIIDKSGVIFHDQLLETVSKAPLSFHASVDSGITVNRFSQDLRLIDMELPSAAFGMATTLSFSVAQFILVAVASKYMAAFLPVLMVILYLIQFFYLRTSRQVRLLDIEHKAPLYSQLIETLSGLPTIRAFQWEDRYEKKNLGLIDESQQPSYQIACLQCWLNLSTDLFIMLLAVVFITLATTLREEIGPRNIGMGLSNVLGFSGTMKSVVTFWVMLEISLGAVSRVRSFVQETKLEGADDPPTAEPKDAENWPTHGHIELRDVVASYPGTGPIINGVSLTVQPGEKIAICGRTGSGKSSLTLALLRMMDLDSGSIIVDGINTKTLPHEYVRKKFVALPQEAYVFDGTVRLNVDPSQTVGDAEIEEALVAVQLWPKVKSRGGLDTVISDDFFSPGEAQLLVFARAMLRNSRILILDEFTSALDEHTGGIVDVLLKERFAGWTIVQIAHKLELVLDYDKVAVLDAGRLMELDSPRRLLERDSIFRSLYEASLQRREEEQAQLDPSTNLHNMI